MASNTLIEIIRKVGSSFRGTIEWVAIVKHVYKRASFPVVAGRDIF